MVRYSWLLGIAFAACTAPRQTGTQLLERVDAEARTLNVGLLTYEGIHRCTATVLRHGLAVTAKHCFKPSEIEAKNLHKIGLGFPRAGATDLRPVVVDGSNVKSVIFDGAQNDIAYVLYDPAATANLQLDATEVSRTLPEAGMPAALIGFPVQSNIVPTFPKVVAKDCAFTAKTGRIGITESNPGYDGLLFETTCEGWWGMSGGPVLTASNAIIGVVTHTFHLTPSGDLDESSISEDAYGKFIKGVAISPFAQAEQLDAMLALDLNEVPSPNVAWNPREECGYDGLDALWQKADAAVRFLEESADFEPAFWLTSDQATSRSMFTEMIRNGNVAAKAARQTAIEQHAWARDVYSGYDTLLANSGLAPFAARDIANLDVTTSYEACDTLACTNYGAFTVIVNAEAARLLFQRNDAAFARKAMQAVLGHELGHYVLDYALLKAQGYTSLDEAQKKEGALKYHLTVDAVGLRLSGVSREDFIEILSKSLTTTVFGRDQLVADSSDRVRCLRELQP